MKISKLDGIKLLSELNIPMNVDMLDDSRKRKNGTECILCCECTKVCPKNTLDIK